MAWGLKPGRGKGCLCSPRCQDQLYSPNSLLFNMSWVSFLRVKRPRSKANHSPLPSAKVKNEWSYTSTPLICLHDVDRENITLTFCLYIKYRCYKMCCHKFGQKILAMPVPNRTHTAQHTGVCTLSTQKASEFLHLCPLSYMFVHKE
jgi:hypothetical protein